LGHVGTISISQPTVRVSAIDSQSCSSCNELLAMLLAPVTSRVQIATGTSGGAPDHERALAVWANGTQVFAQRLQNYGTNGTTTNVGGGCGNGGTQAFSHEPGIGSSGLACTVSGLPPTALATIFNFAAPGNAFVCGTCIWSPFSVTLTPPIVGGQATVQFPIPCLPTLIGSQFETQWTTVDLTQAPCPLVSGVVLTDRLLMTIGN
jgi:hypothetical protein